MYDKLSTLNIIFMYYVLSVIYYKIYFTVDYRINVCYNQWYY